MNIFCFGPRTCHVDTLTKVVETTCKSKGLSKATLSGIEKICNKYDVFHRSPRPGCISAGLMDASRAKQLLEEAHAAGAGYAPLKSGLQLIINQIHGVLEAQEKPSIGKLDPALSAAIASGLHCDYKLTKTVSGLLSKRDISNKSIKSLHEIAERFKSDNIHTRLNNYNDLVNASELVAAKRQRYIEANPIKGAPFGLTRLWLELNCMRAEHTSAAPRATEPTKKQAYKIAKDTIRSPVYIEELELLLKNFTRREI